MMFSTAGLVVFLAATVVLLLLQLAGVAKARDGIVVTPGQIQPVAEFSCSPETANRYKAVVHSTNPLLPANTYAMARSIQHGWVLDGVTLVMALRFNGTPRREGERTSNTYEWVDSTQVQVEFVGEKKEKVAPPPANPQQAQQQGGNPQPRYPPYPVHKEISLTSGPTFEIVVLMALKPFVGHPNGGVVTTVGNPPQIVGHFTWKAAKGSVHDRMVEVTSTSDSLQSRSYQVKLNSEHGWVLQDTADSSEIHVLRPDGELYRERVGGGVQHTGRGGDVDHEVIGTYQWNRERNKEIPEGELYVEVSFKGEKENPEEGERDTGLFYQVGVIESTPDKWHINVPFMLKPKAPPLDIQFGIADALAALILA